MQFLPHMVDPDTDAIDFQNLMGISSSLVDEIFTKSDQFTWSCWQTDKQTDIQTDKRWLIHNLIGGGNKIATILPWRSGTRGASEEIKQSQIYYGNCTDLRSVCVQKKR